MNVGTKGEESNSEQKGLHYSRPQAYLFYSQNLDSGQIVYRATLDLLSWNREIMSMVILEWFDKTRKISEVALP